MIRIRETPQRADIRMSYSIEGDVLRVMIDGVIEEFDFSGLPEGQAEAIEPINLNINPIVSAKKAGDIIDITLIRFYGEDEKPLFEAGGV